MDVFEPFSFVLLSPVCVLPLPQLWVVTNESQARLGPYLQPKFIAIVGANPECLYSMAQTNREGAGVSFPAVEIPPKHPNMYRLHRDGNRKYGLDDYERFDHLAESIASLGSARFGDVGIDCRFLFTKSKWGVMGDRATQAGIIYLDLVFHEPKGCRLHSATVTVTLDESHGELIHNLRRDDPPAPYASLNIPVQMTEWYGPKAIVGRNKPVENRRTMEFDPNIEASGFSGSLFNVCRESAFTSSSQWKFSTRLITDGWKYKAIRWELSENTNEREMTHKNELHTAFAFRHNKQPFFLKVDVDGHLEGVRGWLRNKRSHFRASTKLDNSTAMTLIRFGKQHVFTGDLSYLAKNLESEMMEANIESIPVEIPDSQPVTSERIVPSSNLFEDITSSSEIPSKASPLSNELPRSWIVRGTRHPRVLDAPQSFEYALGKAQSTAPPLEDLARIIGADCFNLPTDKQRSHITQPQNGQVHNPKSTTPSQDLGDEIHVNGSIQSRSKAFEQPDRVQPTPKVAILWAFIPLLLAKLFGNPINPFLVEGKPTQRRIRKSSLSSQ